MAHVFVRTICALTLCTIVVGSIAVARAQGARSEAVRSAPATSAPLPPDYVIGADDVLSIVFWRDKDMSADVVVRPDGQISVPLLNDIRAAGYTPEQLGQVLVNASSKYIEQPSVTVIVKEINSRRVFILGQVAKPGAFPLISDMNVLHVIALAGGVLEYADMKNITIVRKESGGERRFKFNYKEVLKGRSDGQNLILKPGDTVIVP